jgi:hypothetical protein
MCMCVCVRARAYIYIYIYIYLFILRFTHKTCFSIPLCKNLLKIFNFNEQQIVLKRLAKIIMLKMLEQIIMLRILAKIHVGFHVKC